MTIGYRGLYYPIYWGLLYISNPIGESLLTNQYNGMTEGFKHCVDKVVILLKNRDYYEDLTKEPTERVHHIVHFLLLFYMGIYNMEHGYIYIYIYMTHICMYIYIYNIWFMIIIIMIYTKRLKQRSADATGYEKRLAMSWRCRENSWVFIQGECFVNVWYEPWWMVSQVVVFFSGYLFVDGNWRNSPAEALLAFCQCIIMYP